ncbi:MAG: energy transducer TonB [Chitinophagaceae bacterium]|nr:energy transducer TonB [Chitinophagaceae bacterium]
MKRVFLSVFIFAACNVAAQSKQYYDWQWKPCDASKARFISLAEKTDSGWLRKDFFLATKKLQMRGLYEDSLTKVRNGWFLYFYANGKMSSIGQYVKGKKDGLWLSWYFNGMMQDSVFYNSGYPAYIFKWHSNGYIADSSVYNPDGTAVHVYWFDNGVPSSAGRSYEGEQEGRWKYFHKNGKPAALEDYRQGKLVSRIYYNEEGIALTDTTNRDREADFKGGNKKWRSFMENKLEFPAGVKLVNTDVITVVINATIDEEGNVTDTYVDIPFNPLFDEEALRVMKKSPKWVPAISHNRRVKYYVRQPVFFGQEVE